MSTARSGSGPGPVGLTKAVIPAAGLGTRFLPATKATPKEMLPVVDKPAIQYVVEEAVRAGLTDILMVTARGKGAIEDHFDRSWELEAALEKKDDQARLDLVRAVAELATIHYVRQGTPLGLGHAVLCAAQHVGDEAFAVLLGDDLIEESEPLLSTMADVQAKHGGSVIALMEVAPEQVHLYGCAAVAQTGEDDIVTVTGLVEKPAAADAPSNLAVVGRYVLSPTIFDVLADAAPGRGGEIQLTDALQRLSADEPMHGVVFRGRRFDTGDRADYLRTVVRYAVARDDLGPGFLRWLREFVDEQRDAGTA